MSSNKKVKEELIRRYGNKCFIERLKLRDTRGLKYKGCGQYKRMKQLTYHHIKMKKDGGKATIENGALLSAENHQWFHQQPNEEQRIMNGMFQDLKRRIDSQELPVIITDDLEAPIEVECAEISIENNRLQVKKLSKADKKREQRAKKKAEEKQKAKEKRKLQRLRKEFEDR